MVHENAHNKISMQCDKNTTTNLTLNLLRNGKFALQCEQTIANYTILAPWLWLRLTNQHKVRHCTWHLPLWTNSGVARAPFCAPTPFVLGFPDNLHTILWKIHCFHLEAFEPLRPLSLLRRISFNSIVSQIKSRVEWYPMVFGFQDNSKSLKCSLHLPG